MARMPRQRKGMTGAGVPVGSNIARPDPVGRLQSILLEQQPDSAARLDILHEIHELVLAGSRHMDSPNFRAFDAADLQRMVLEYDKRFLDGACQQALMGRPLNFRIAPRLTNAGGLTKWRSVRNRLTGVTHESFEISVSSHLLFQTFRDEQREIKVVGLTCTTRLEAMQRIVEHELIHLAEKLAWDDSSCRQRRFQEIAHRLFGHREHTHQLVTTAEVARTQLGIQPGTRVRFEMDGHWFQGIVNKLTKRATVLVPDRDGRMYSDGQRYTRFYVPLGMLHKVEFDDT